MMMARGGSWWIYIMIFFVVQGVLSTVGFAASSLLGFPAAWITFLNLPIAGAVIYLFYKGYPITAYGLLACALVGLISVLALLRAVTIEKPTAPSPEVERLVEANNENADFTDVLLGNASYDDFLSAYGDYDYVLETDKDTFLLAYSEYEAAPRTQLTINFPEFKSLDGLWAFKDGSARLSGAYAGNFEALPTDNWINAAEVNFDPPAEAVMKFASPQPYLVIALPLQQNLGDEAIEFQATLNVTYPTNEGVEEATLTRTVSVYLASNQYYLYRDEYNNWQRSRRIIETPIWAGLLGVTAVAGVAAFVLVKRGALHPTGGFVMVVKRASGVKQLGVEAHPLSAVDVVLPQDIEGGVVLGVVTAQSPAGRSGLRSGDIVYMLDGKPIHSPKEFNRMTSRYKKGEQGQAHVWRDGQRVDVIITF